MDHVILYKILVLCGYVESMSVNEFIAIISKANIVNILLPPNVGFSLGEGIIIKEFCWLILNHENKIKSYGSYKSNVV